MTKIAILGSGRVASVLAGKLRSIGYEVVVGIRNPDAPGANWSGPDVAMLETAVAIGRAEIVFNATPGESAVTYLEPFKDQLRGKILVDVSNAMRRDDKGMPIGLFYPDSSVAEHLQVVLPDTSVVKTLNTMLFTVMGNPKSVSPSPVVFLSGNDKDAKAEVRKLLTAFGWDDALVEDLGPIFTARGPEAFMHFVPHIIGNHGFAPFALTIAR